MDSLAVHMDDYRTTMLSSTPTVSKGSNTLAPANGYSNGHLHPSSPTLPPQPAPQSQPQQQAHSLQDPHDSHRVSLLMGAQRQHHDSGCDNPHPHAHPYPHSQAHPNNGVPRLHTRSDSPPPRRQSKLLYFQPNGYHSQFMPSARGEEAEDLEAVLGEEASSGQVDRNLVVRLDLRELGGIHHKSRPPRKPSLRQPAKRRSVDTPSTSFAHHPPPASIQTTLSTGSWPGLKATQNPIIFPTPIPQSVSVAPPQHLYQTIDAPHTLVTSGYASDLSTGRNRRTPPIDTFSQRSSVSLEQDPGFETEEGRPLKKEEDDEYVDSGSQAVKRRSEPRRLATDSANKKRTRSSNQGAAKKKKVEETTSRGQQEPVVKRREQPKQSLDKKPSVLKDLVAVTGDDHALKYNNDYCEACLGLGQFICCDSCPKAFHFTCCQPPVDPLDLPDEWNCNECRATLNPPKQSSNGIFKQLLDNVNKSNPKSFSLPPEIRSFFKGVATNSDGEYADTLDYKPAPTRHTGSLPSASAQAEEDPFHLKDSQGNIRLCFHCNKSAYGGRTMISCDHCPLNWHLDCLSPPMTSLPPSTRKWMCPNHAEHVLPRRRKRKDAVPILIVDPFTPNDGDIEVILDQRESKAVKSSWDNHTTGVVYRIPEKSIKLGFLQKCQRLKQTEVPSSCTDTTVQPATALPAANARAVTAEAGSSIPSAPTWSASSAWKFDMLVAAAMANENGLGSEFSSPKLPGYRPYEEIQDTVLRQMTDPVERQEYMCFRAFQRHLREHGSEEMMKQWIDHKHDEEVRYVGKRLLQF